MSSRSDTSGHSLTHLCHHVVVAALVLLGLVTVSIFVAGTMSSAGRSLLLMTALFTLLSFAALRCAHLYDSGSHRGPAVFGVAACAVAFILSTIAIWDVFADVFWIHLAGLAVNVAVATAHLCVMMPIRREGPRHPMHVRIAASFTMASTVVCALLIALFFLGTPLLAVDTYIQLIIIMLVVTFIGTAVTPVLVHIRRHKEGGFTHAS